MAKACLKTPGATVPTTFTSKVSRALAGSRSVRTTIPEAVAAILGVEPGSTLTWTVEPGTGRVAVAAEAPAKKSSRRD